MSTAMNKPLLLRLATLIALAGAACSPAAPNDDSAGVSRAALQGAPGLFLVTSSGAVYYSDGTAACAFQSPAHYQLVTGRRLADGTADFSGLQTYALFPAALRDDGTCKDFREMVPFVEKAALSFATEIPLFEDSAMYPLVDGLVYRKAGGAASIAPSPMADASSKKAYRLQGPMTLVHPAMLSEGAFRLRLNVEAGEVDLMVLHNGLNDAKGVKNTSPGLSVRLGTQSTYVTDVLTGQILAYTMNTVPRHQFTDVTVAWKRTATERSLRLDFGGRSYLDGRLPSTVAEGGGVAVYLQTGASVAVESMKVLWQDQRKVRLYDGYDQVFEPNGALLRRLTPLAFPLPGETKSCSAASGWTYGPVSVDAPGERVLVAYGCGNDFNPTDAQTIVGFAVRSLRNGKLIRRVSASELDGCTPDYGGGGFDQRQLFSAEVDGRHALCWLDWSSFDAGAGLMTRDGDTVATSDLREVAADPGYRSRLRLHDPHNALDGSLARVLAIDWERQSHTYLIMHPKLRRFAARPSFTLPNSWYDEAGTLNTRDAWNSDTGPDGKATTFAVRDRDGAFLEHWNYFDPSRRYRHTRNMRFNVFTQGYNYFGPAYYSASGRYTDYANLMIDWLSPGDAVARRYAMTSGGLDGRESPVTHEATYRVRLSGSTASPITEHMNKEATIQILDGTP